MKLKAIAAIALTAVTLPLAASAQGAGHEQLARALGVDGANYTTAQLAKAAGYLSDDSSTARQQIAFILGNPAGGNDGVIFGSRSGGTAAIFPQDFGTNNPTALNTEGD